MYADDTHPWMDVDEFENDSAELGEALRHTLHPHYAGAAPDVVESALLRILDALPAAEGFNFEKALHQIGQGAQRVLRDPTVGQIAGAALPVAGAALGTFVGGPVGTAVGGQLGGMAAQSFTGRKPPRAEPGMPAQGLATPVVGQSVAVPPPHQGSTAAAQLLQLTQNPDMLKSLVSLALGSLGRSSIPVGSAGQSVPLGAFMNLLGTLATQAAADADQLVGKSQATSPYLLDGEGHFLDDPLVPEHRAELLYKTLLAAEEERLLDGEDDETDWDQGPWQ